MSAPIKNFTLDQGAGFSRQLTWLDARKRPVQLVGWTFEMPLVNDQTNQVLLTLTPENGGLVIDPLAGKIKFQLSDAQTAALDCECVRYMLNYQAPGNFKQRLLQGRITINRGLP